MGEDLKRLVVTDSHRKSVKALTDHNFVLLLGAPAAGKSTIGASLAVGAADLWRSLTIRATSPIDVKERLNPNERQFFWVDDAWGSTQYRRDTIEAWNQILPLMQSAIQKGTQFLLTSRDYIWKAAQHDLKTQALPLLGRSQVIINVQALAPGERAQILYNHLRFGDQPKTFRAAIKPSLPYVAASDHFLPETARRLGSTFFTPKLDPNEATVLEYFARPAAFLLETIRNLAPDCRAAIALVFLSGGRVPSPVPEGNEIGLASSAFGVGPAAIKGALNFLNGSLLLLAHDDQGRYWTYKHPTIGDCFAQLVASDPELMEVYLRGAKPELILREVVCAGTMLMGAPVCVPHHLYSLLIERIKDQPDYQLSGFISYRADRRFAELVLERRPDILNRLKTFYAPVAEDMDAALLVRLHELNLVPEPVRLAFVATVCKLAIEEADASFLKDEALRTVFLEDEIDSILHQVEARVLNEIPQHVKRLQNAWKSEYEPSGYFDTFRDAVKTFVDEIPWGTSGSIFHEVSSAVDAAVQEMEAEYTEPETLSTPVIPKARAESPLAHIFRDVDE